MLFAVSYKFKQEALRKRLFLDKLDKKYDKIEASCETCHFETSSCFNKKTDIHYKSSLFCKVIILSVNINKYLNRRVTFQSSCVIQCVGATYRS